MIGLRQIGTIGPNFSAFMTAKLSAAKVFYIIDRTPKIDPSVETGVKLNREQVLWPPLLD